MASAGPCATDERELTTRDGEGDILLHDTTAAPDLASVTATTTTTNDHDQHDSDIDAYGTDYGSDFSPEEEEIIEGLLAGAPLAGSHSLSLIAAAASGGCEHNSSLLTAHIPDIEDNPIVVTPEYDGDGDHFGLVGTEKGTLRLSRGSGGGLLNVSVQELGTAVANAVRAGSDVAEYREGTGVRATAAPRKPASRSKSETDAGALSAVDGSQTFEGDTWSVPSTATEGKSPMERFRSKTRSKKPALSVTDLVSPAWCELQYSYALARWGRKRPTAEMKKGTAVHAKLEEEIYTTVQVEVQTKEDILGLQIWNVIQGLKTLADTGFTRELKVWGSIDGVLVTGVIDELAVAKDDDADELNGPGEKGEQRIDQFFTTLDSSSSRHRKSSKVFLCDVKTRSAKSVPNTVSFRPTKIQLMLYHRLLGDLAAGKFDLSMLADRQGVDIQAPFSDAFIAQVGSLNADDASDFSSTQSSSTDPASSQDSISLLLAHNSIAQLWGLMLQMYQRLLPAGRDSLGETLRAEYRSPSDGAVTGEKSFVMDYSVLDSYLGLAMKWWTGQREAEGVPVEEAFKCRICEFAEHCEWRLEKVAEATRASRAKAASATSR